MKFTLKDYQTDAVREVLDQLRKARKRWREDTEQCDAVAEQVRIFLTDVATDRAMGLTDEHKAALKRMRELGMKSEHIDRIYAVREECHAQHLAQAEARLAERFGDVH